MNVDQPWALLALLPLPLIWWWHRRARPAGDRVFSAFFLVRPSAGEGAGARQLRAPLVMALRLLAACAFVAAAVGLSSSNQGGTVALAVGPFEVDPDWPEPLTIIRAGRVPTVEPSADVAPVITPPNWVGAMLLARKTTPAARFERVGVAAPADVRGAGAVLFQGQVLVTAVADRPPVLVVGDARFPMEQRAGDWAVRGDFAPGIGRIEVVDGGPGWSVCLPDSSPLRVSDRGWPPEVLSALEAVPGVRFVPSEQANWRVGVAPAHRRGWPAFAPSITTFEFAESTDRGPAPLAFAVDLPPPGAVVRRWRALSGVGAPVLFAADAVVADHGASLGGSSRRFGFSPADTDLPQTAGWPVLFLDAVQADRAGRSPCRAVVAGAPVPIISARPVQLTAPSGRRWTVDPKDDVAWIDGLDELGSYRLDDGRGEAWLVTRPAPPRAADPELAEPLRASPSVDRSLPLAIGLGALLLLGLTARRERSLWFIAGLALVSVALVSPRLIEGPLGKVVIAIDTSASMPDSRVVAGQLAHALGSRYGGRVEGDATRLRVVAGQTEAAAEAQTAPLKPGGNTRHAPLLSVASELAGPGGAVVLLTDGRAADGPASSAVPVFPVANRALAPDARIVSGRSLRLGEQIFTRVVVQADRQTKAEVRVGEVSVEVELEAHAPVPVRVVGAYQGAPQIVVKVEAVGDPLAANDRLVLPVEGADLAAAVVIGDAGLAWAAAAGLDARLVHAADLREQGARLSRARAVILHETPARAIPPTLVARIRRWVEAGGVLLLAGRAQAFGPGGWAGTPLDALSPLAADPRPPGAGRVAVALAIDRSGSMSSAAGGIGADALGEVASALAGGLAKDDTVALIAFDAAVSVLLPATRVGALSEDSLPVPASARGGTRLVPAVDAALATLKEASAETRVVVVVSDGQFADQERASRVLPARLEAAGARLLIVLVGASPQVASAEAIAPGRVLLVPPGQSAPSLAAVASLGAASDLSAAGGPVQPEPAWRARVGGPAPPVAGITRTRLREGARTMASLTGDPVLAEWGVGRGRVIALATDRWALTADQWAVLLSPATAPAPAGPQLTVADGRIWLRTSPADPPPTGRPEVRDEAGLLAAVFWRYEGPGVVSAPAPDGPPGVLEITASTIQGAVSARVSRPPPAELAQTGPDARRLWLQADLTGGVVLDEGPEGVILAPVLAALRPTPGPDPSAPLAIAALICVLLDTRSWAHGRGSRAGSGRHRG